MKFHLKELDDVEKYGSFYDNSLFKIGNEAYRCNWCSFAYFASWHIRWFVWKMQLFLSTVLWPQRFVERLNSWLLNSKTETGHFKLRRGLIYEQWFDHEWIHGVSIHFN